MIKTDINGNIGIISIDRPPVNAINPELVSLLSESLDSFHSNDSIQGVILEGRSGIFSAGLDITHLFPIFYEMVYWSKRNLNKPFNDISMDWFSRYDKFTPSFTAKENKENYKEIRTELLEF